jgi:hypothetical protein
MDRLTTKTIAEIYLQQGHLQEAYEIYKALAEKNPFDEEIENRLEELRKKLHSSSPSSFPCALSREEKIRYLEKWLVNIRKRRPN